MSGTILSVLRILLSGRALSSVALGLLVAGPLAGQFGILEAVTKALPWTLLALGGFELNDWFDADKDRLIHSTRIIPAGRASSGIVLAVAALSILMAVVSGLQLNTTSSEVLIFLGATVGILFYSNFAIKFAPFKIFYAAFLCTLPLMFVLAVRHYPPVYWWTCVASFLFFCGRELLMDVRDVDGDLAGGMATLPSRLGSSASVNIAFGLISIVPAALAKGSILFAIGFGASAVVVFVAASIWRVSSLREQRWIVVGMWIPMVIGASVLI